MKERGFTLVEIVMVALIMSVITGVVLALTSTGQSLYNTTEHQMHVSSRAQALADRLFSELRQASFQGEDLDDDDDPGDLAEEDTNNNGRIDDDWSLADGASAQSLSFNAAIGGGLSSDVITFRFDGETVFRESGTANPRTAVLAKDVTALTFTRQGRRITINIVVQSGVTGDGTPGSSRGGRQLSVLREVLLRN
ncbi:MAG: PilW family protein [Planctomycetota bacterium]